MYVKSLRHSSALYWQSPWQRLLFSVLGFVIIQPINIFVYEVGRTRILHQTKDLETVNIPVSSRLTDRC